MQRIIPRNLRESFTGEFHIGSSKAKRYDATGEYRPPRAGEFYLSGSDEEGKPTAYRAPNDLGSPYWIAREHVPVTCPHCGHVK